MAMNNANARLVYENAAAIFQKKGIDPNRIFLTDTTIRIEADLSTASTSLNFFLSEGQGASTFPSERRLGISEAIVVYAMGFYVGKAASVSDAGFKLYTYPDQTVFSATGEAENLDALFNVGRLRLNYMSQDIIPGMDLLRFKHVPQTQGAATAPPIAQFDGEDSLKVIEPNLYLFGKQRTTITVSLPAGLAVGGFANDRAVLVLRCKLAQNVPFAQD